MRFEYIVLLIVAFNVVTAVMKNRAKKKAVEQAARGGAGSAQRPVSKPGYVPYEVDEDDEEPEVEYQDPYAGHRPARAGIPDRSVEDRRQETPVAEIPSLGRDILDQLARDLGLRIPRPSVPAPVPATAPAPAPVSASQAKPSIPARETPAPAGVAPRGVHGVRAEPVRSRTGVGASPLRDSLIGKDRLREAFVLKEILDLPLSRRGRR